MADSPWRQRLSGVLAPRLWLGIGLSLAAVYLAVKDLQWHEVLLTLSKVHPLLLLLLFGSVLCNTWLKAVRWRLLFYPTHSQLSVLVCLLALLVGQLANKLLPARLGDLVRVYVISESTETSRALALATTIVEKAMDSVMLLALVVLLSLHMPPPLWLARSSLLLSGLLVILLVVAVVLAGQGHKILDILRQRCEDSSPSAWLQAFTRVVEISQSLQALSDPLVQAQAWAWSLLIWVTAAATNVLAFWSLGLGANLLPSLVLLIVLMVGAALPASPLQIGVFHYLCILTLSLFGFEQGVALSYALVLHLAVHLPIVLGGAAGLWVCGLDLRQLDVVQKEGG